ncbi:MAG: sigma factor-like helix-turn-helix DNA-binding protein, partial [Thermoguttaceae bacterium]
MARVKDRYPRPGERLAPYELREFLKDPLPAEICRDYDVAGLRLCDLDETAWERFPPAVMPRLARLVVDRISHVHFRKEFHLRRFPRPAAFMRLGALRLERRTLRCLKQERFAENIERLGDRTLGQIMSIRSFGPRCLVDLLCALEALGAAARARESQAAKLKAARSESLSAAATRLAELPEADRIRSDDPRFSRIVQGLDSEAKTAKDLAQRILARAQDPPGPDNVAEELGQMADRIKRLPTLPLEEELIQIFASTCPPRNAEIVIGYYGWRDGRPHTLTEVGRRFGITRERVRQVCAKLTRKPLRLGALPAPVMDRALSTIHGRLPAAAAEIEAELGRSGMTAVGMSLENVAAAAKLLGRTADFRVVEIAPGKARGPRLAVRTADQTAVPAIVDAAKKHVYFHGLAMIDEIHEIVASKWPGAGRDLVARTLPLVEGFAWLDERSGWFRIDGVGKHGLPKTIDKVLAVAGEVTIAELRTAMARNRRLWKSAPPESVLLEFCRH